MSKDTIITVPQTAGVQELLAAGKALGQPIRESGFRPAIILPVGFEVKTLEHETDKPLPDHIKQAVTLTDAESFIGYVKKWKRGETVIFATLPSGQQSAQFRAVFDWHLGGQGADHYAARCAHTALYPCPFSEPWKAWSGIDGKAQSQRDFIDFVDENAPDIVSPAAAELLELGLTFDSKTEVTFASKVDRTTGGRNLTYSETVDARGGAAGNIKVPDLLHLRLPVFENGKAFEVQARVEWVPRDGKLMVTVHLKRVEEVIRLALSEVRGEIEEQTGITVLNGKAA